MVRKAARPLWLPFSDLPGSSSMLVPAPPPLIPTISPTRFSPTPWLPMPIPDPLLPVCLQCLPLSHPAPLPPTFCGRCSSRSSSRLVGAEARAEGKWWQWAGRPQAAKWVGRLYTVFPMHPQLEAGAFCGDRRSWKLSLLLWAFCSHHQAIRMRRTNPLETLCLLIEAPVFKGSVEHVNLKHSCNSYFLSQRHDTS